MLNKYIFNFIIIVCYGRLYFILLFGFSVLYIINNELERKFYFLAIHSFCHLYINYISILKMNCIMNRETFIIIFFPDVNVKNEAYPCRLSWHFTKYVSYVRRCNILLNIPWVRLLSVFNVWWALSLIIVLKQLIFLELNNKCI